MYFFLFWCEIILRNLAPIPKYLGSIISICFIWLCLSYYQVLLYNFTRNKTELLYDTLTFRVFVSVQVYFSTGDVDDSKKRQLKGHDGTGFTS